MVVVVVVGDVWGSPGGLQQVWKRIDVPVIRSLVTALPRRKRFPMTRQLPNTPRGGGIPSPHHVCVHKLADDGLDKKERSFFPKRAVIVQDFASIPAITQMFCRKQPRNIANSALITVFRAHFLYCSN